MRRPKEPSVIGFMTIGVTGTSIVSGFSVPDLLIAFALLLIHLFSFDEAFSSLRAKRFPWKAIAINASPYLILGVLNKASLLLIPFLIFASYFLITLKSKSEELKYVVGSSIPLLPSIAIPLALGKWNWATWIYWALLTLYAIATAAYVETKLPWRKMDRRVPLVIWLPSYALLPLKPLIVIALIEPTIKFLKAIIDGSTIEPSRLKEFGWREMARSVAFSILLLVSLTLYIRQP